MSSEHDEVEVIGSFWSTKGNEFTMEEYAHITVKRAARTAAWPARLKRIGWLRKQIPCRGDLPQASYFCSVKANTLFVVVPIGLLLQRFA